MQQAQQKVHKIPHPQAHGKWLHFLADVPHIFKNIKSSIVNGNIWTLSDSTVEEYHLKSPDVSIGPVQDLAKFQEDKDLKLAPKLTVTALMPSHSF